MDRRCTDQALPLTDVPAVAVVAAEVAAAAVNAVANPMRRGASHNVARTPLSMVDTSDIGPKIVNYLHR